MTPYECAADVVEFLKSKLEIGESGQIYVGFLPRIDKAKDAWKRCPSIAVRASDVDDEKEGSTARILIYVLTYDEDMIYGSQSLSHILEKIRYEILANNPISDEWWLELGNGGMHSSIPDEQPFPYWWGVIEMIVAIPQPQNNKWINQYTR